MSKITPETLYIRGYLGIEEPSPLLMIDLNAIDLMILPGVAFDRFGGRLGRGGGYYDRMLEAYTGRTVAAAFDFQLVEQVPVEPHDRPVDAVVTETNTIQVQHTD
jgi:5-formyltetrahydrofolate cyclo-ligase